MGVIVSVAINFAILMFARLAQPYLFQIAYLFEVGFKL